jgi:hypothetical protein
VLDEVVGDLLADDRALDVGRAFFGTDKIAFSAFSNSSGTTRGFSRFYPALKEVLDVRKWMRSGGGSMWSSPRAHEFE